MKMRRSAWSFGPSGRFRSSAVLVAVLCSLSFMCLGASCSGGDGDEPQGGQGTTNGSGHEESEASRVRELRQVDLSELSRAERRVWIDLINEQLSPCNQPISVGRCVAENRSCAECVPAARYLERLVREGYERPDIEELYELRYGRESAVEIHHLDGDNPSPVRGAEMGAAITIVEFSDFECPYCGRAHPILQQVLREFEGRVQVVFKQYPLSMHSHAQPAARAAIAAGNQGKFWEMHDTLFEHQTSLEEEDLLHYAEELGLDMERFRRDMEAPATQAIIDRDREEGHRLDVNGTPAFFIRRNNGQGARFRTFREPPSSLPTYIREALDQD